VTALQLKRKLFFCEFKFWERILSHIQADMAMINSRSVGTQLYLHITIYCSVV